MYIRVAVLEWKRCLSSHGDITVRRPTPDSPQSLCSMEHELGLSLRLHSCNGFNCWSLNLLTYSELLLQDIVDLSPNILRPRLASHLMRFGAEYRHCASTILHAEFKAGAHSWGHIRGPIILLMLATRWLYNYCNLS